MSRRQRNSNPVQRADSRLADAVVEHNSNPQQQATENRRLAAETLATERQTEAYQYGALYQDAAYRMGEGRKRDVNKVLARLAHAYDGNPGSLLDVGAGRGEALEMARGYGFNPVLGTEVVPELLNENVLHAYAHELPFTRGQFDHVVCFDTLEHLLPQDVELAIAELWHVCSKTLTLSASDRPSVWGGQDLHISARPAEEWEAIIGRICGQPLSPRATVGSTPCWRICKPQ